MESIEKKIREIAKDLFAGGKIDLFIGYERGTVPLMSRPSFIHLKEVKPEDSLDRLVWNSFCANNLAVFLPKLFERDPLSRKKEEAKPRIGIVVKGCDLRSIAALMKEKQVPRDNVVLVGVPCRGMIDRRKVEDMLSGEEVADYRESAAGVLSVTTRKGRKESLKREDILQEACLECRYPVPEKKSAGQDGKYVLEANDYLVEGVARKPGNGGYGRISEFESRSPEERWEYFKKEIAKCIRCNACRQACPTCYCKECFAEQTDLRWIGVSTELTDAMIFHLIRIFHQAGRCVECDACYRACPMGVDLRTFTRKMVKDVDELFGYLPDFSLEEIPPISTFKEDDRETFITEP